MPTPRPTALLGPLVLMRRLGRGTCGMCMCQVPWERSHR
ncbi:hypothetical protein STRTUCAR8_04224 [Streptomyces turgidiscabies Car8]|uniref:Uncharacterized protein n=1 Tax=Streptomyces turgidiscabies (strain Car8) TaxID=698760 RepID=L7FGS4_STRT8|nr:hypothetical protein STRTUCAR8_04224 [Streptomyces turgidiscabies Car8]